jgi:deoxyhypusine synthase
MKNSKISTTNNEGMISRAIRPSDFDMLLEMDKKMYPTNSPVTKETIKSWYIRNPEFGMIYEKNNQIVGVFILIPLNDTNWKKLIDGKLKESEMNANTIFDNLKDKKIGLHIYHTEKLDSNIKEFYKRNFLDLSIILGKLKKHNPRLKLEGISSFSVSESGIGLRTKLGYKERNFISDEHILEKNGEKFVAESKKEADEKIKKDYKYLNRCKMLVLYPNEKSIVWDYLKNNNKAEIASQAILKESQEPEGRSIKGYDFNKKFDFNEMMKSFATTGAQASNLARAIEIVQKMKKEKAFIYLGYTSNMVTTGNREIIRYLVEHKLIDYLVTTAGGIEEDFIKCFGDFKLGEFNLNGSDLRDKGINRAGNILIPNSRYLKFEEFALAVLEKYKLEIKTPSDVITSLAKEINNKESIYYWAHKNNIPIYCPAIMDGSLGDMIYFYKNYKNKDFKLDIVEDTENFNNSSIGKEKTGMIILGGGVVKHAICNCNLYRNGANFAVYINTAQEFDGSDSGARPDEAVSWGKIAQKSESVKVYADATIVFPLLVKGSLID